MCNRNTIEFLGIWEQLNNPDFKVIEFDDFKKQAGLNSFTLTPKQWIEQTAAIGIFPAMPVLWLVIGLPDWGLAFAKCLMLRVVFIANVHKLTLYT